jgi:hypothetical protein
MLDFKQIGENKIIAHIEAMDSDGNLKDKESLLNIIKEKVLEFSPYISHSANSFEDDESITVVVSNLLLEESQFVIASDSFWTTELHIQPYSQYFTDTLRENKYTDKGTGEHVDTIMLAKDEILIQWTESLEDQEDDEEDEEDLFI